jgi:hypothetical protein
MPIVSQEEARDRIGHFFHRVVDGRVLAGHSLNEENCWSCDVAAYAAVTLPKNQEARLD